MQYLILLLGFMKFKSVAEDASALPSRKQYLLGGHHGRRRRPTLIKLMPLLPLTKIIATINRSGKYQLVKGNQCGRPRSSSLRLVSSSSCFCCCCCLWLIDHVAGASLTMMSIGNTKRHVNYNHPSIGRRLQRLWLATTTTTTTSNDK